ncbi:MAG: hypothetical protein JO187_11845 [Acidobacteria bacterium]|nr:hypothetical protein [Acidobacteriota bacterium]
MRAGAQDQDPPARVARLNYLTGSVSLQPAGESEWVAAIPNRPITTGDNLWTDSNSRAELHVGSTAIRMGPTTNLTLLDLDEQTSQLRLSQGSLIMQLRHLDDGDLVEVDTPNLAFTLQRTGEYRIDVGGDGETTTVTVWRGRGEVVGGGYSYLVAAGQQARFVGMEDLDHQIEQIAPYDDFDNWAFDRDRREQRLESSNYISEEMTGYEDLDDYGQWRYVADYGPVWTPTRIAAGWAPYRYGHWVWIEPWGWTWVEDEPWGFAPFHYGRWAFVESGWCWVPGPMVVRPVYAPALVAFVGGEGGFRLAGGPGVAWFPLAPREVYIPPYRVSRTYVNNVNITNTRVNVTQVTNVYNVYTTNNANVTRISYANQRAPNAVTAVSRETFVNAQPVSRNIARVDTQQITTAQAVTHVAPVQPVKTSVLGAGEKARSTPPPAVVNRQVVATRNPTPVRAPFERQPAVNVQTVAPSSQQPRSPRTAEAPASQPPVEQSRSVTRATEPTPRQMNPQASQGMPPAQPEQKPVRRPPARAAEQQTPEAVHAQTSRPEQPQGSRFPEASGGGRVSQPVHPLVRPAPPVQERPQQQQSEETKYRAWQQQRERQTPQPPARPEERKPAPPRN